MGLPILSMEDEELFPKNMAALYYPKNRQIAEHGLVKFLHEFDQIWWSRLVISTRGYVINLASHTDEQLFSVDDAFILIHKVFAERDIPLRALEFVKHLNTLFSIPDLLDVLNRLDPINSGYLEINPFYESPYRTAFETLFGNCEKAKNLQTANMQKLAYDVFMRLLNILLTRYNTQNGQKKRGIRFDKDPEYQPGERVVLFQEFYKGNRTWILLNFDRYLLEFWKPNGIPVIFGDAYVDKKRRAGLFLCDSCGMLEQVSKQFPIYKNKRFCTESCFATLLDQQL